MYGRLSGFDPVYSIYSIGNLLMLKVLEKCIKLGIKEYDFMQGNEAYKSDWTKNYRRNLNIKFVNRRSSSRIINLGIRTIKQSSLLKILEKYITV